MELKYVLVFAFSLLLLLVAYVYLRNPVRRLSLHPGFRRVREQMRVASRIRRGGGKITKHMKDYLIREGKEWGLTLDAEMSDAFGDIVFEHESSGRKIDAYGNKPTFASWK